MDVSKNVNSWINLIFVGAFHCNGRILKANLSSTRKSRTRVTQKVLFVFVSFFYALKAELQVLKFGFCRIKLG